MWQSIKRWWQRVVAKLDKPSGGTTTPPAPGDASTVRPAIGNGTITGYGPVNMWWKMPHSALFSVLNRMQRKNVRFFVVEALGNAGEDVLANQAKMAEVKEKLEYIAGECRKKGIWLNPIVANDNAGKGNYQNGGVKLEKREAQCREFIDWMASQPWQEFAIPCIMAEPQTDAGRRLQAYAAKKFKMAGFKIMHNQGDRPQGNETISGIKSDYFCYHNTSVNDWPKSADAIVLSDTGAAIRQLNLGGDLNGKGNPDAIRKWVAAGKARGQAVVAMYAFQVAEYDEDAIDALSAGDEAVQPPEAPASGELLPSQVKWLGTNYAAAKQTVTLSGVAMSGKHLNFKASKIDWPPQGAKKCKAVGILIRKIGDEYKGGKVEWCVVERGWYDIVTNTADGYNGATMPANGETCWAALGHPTSGKEISSIVPFTWKA